MRLECAFAVGLTACFTLLLWPGLSDGQIPGFRDTYHFYFPQLHWLDRQASTGEFFPAWNHLEGIGISVPGQGSSGLYYPLRLIYGLPLDLPCRLSLFILLHLLIAAVGIRFAGHHIGLGTTSGWLAATSFSLSCPVFFQHTNLIYLTSAAWIGFALTGLFWIFGGGQRQWTGPVLLGLSTSMMFLAGDPHTTANTFIVAGGWLVLLTAAGCWTRSTNLLSLSAMSAVKILAATVLCCTVTFVQWLPLIRQAVASRGEGIVHHTIYDFSLSPWHTLTCLLPTLGGHFAPTNSRLFEVIPAEGRMWIPSLYFGAVPLLGALLLTHKRCSVPRFSKRLAALAGLSLLAAMGSYTVVWLLREVATAIGAQAIANRLPPDPTSGLYWLVTQIVPGYELFRYPAKWSVWFVAAASLAAGLGWQSCKREPTSRHLPSTRWLIAISTICACAIACGATGLILAHSGAQSIVRINEWIAEEHSDSWLGDPSLAAYAKTLTFSGAVPLCVICLVVLLVRLAAPAHSTGKTRHWSHRCLGGLVTLLAMAELTMVATQWISFVRPPNLNVQHAQLLAQTGNETPFVWADTTEASIMRDLSLADQVSAVDSCNYQDTFLLGKISSTAQLRCLSSTLSLTPSSLDRITGHMSRLDNLSFTQPRLDAALAEIGVTHRLFRNQIGLQTQLQWKAIESPRPLCNLAAQHPTAPAIQWNWVSSSQLTVLCQTERRNLLTIRQYSDDGWKATLMDGKRPENQPVALTIETSELGFVQLWLPPGEWRVELSRRRFW